MARNGTTTTARKSPSKEPRARAPKASGSSSSEPDELGFIRLDEFRRVRSATIDPDDRLHLIADMCRLNALTAIQTAGSGHIGSSFSACDVMTYLYHEELDTAAREPGDPDRDVFFSSKGHDAPAWYAVLHSIGRLPGQQLARLRRIDGPSGHPDVRNEWAETTTGSLGLGLSKAKGLALAKRMAGRKGRIVVMTGDGELQEGQNYEALQAAAHLGLDNLVLIVDHNEVQTDMPVSEVCDLGYLEDRLRTFGWVVARCDGHDAGQLREVFAELSGVRGRPQALIAETIKGCGVTFMEHPRAIREHGGYYPWHAGAPTEEVYARAVVELEKRVNRRFQEWGMSKLVRTTRRPKGPSLRIKGENVGAAFGAALLDQAKHHPELVVLDADLAADCHVRAIAETLPKQFIECGIAEQDMVSTAGGLARGGRLPVVTSFAAFLCARANEQIFANACDGARVVYACHYAGLVPAAAGVTHQSVRDISLLGALEGVTIIQPSNEVEAREAVRYAIEEARGSVALRLQLGESTGPIPLPEPCRLRCGQGSVLAEGEDVLLMAYGPVLLHETLGAAARLAKEGITARVVAMPWLNRIDATWLGGIVENRAIYVIEDHAVVGGLGDRVRAALSDGASRSGARRAATVPVVRIFGVEGLPAWGGADEVLAHHGLDASSLAQRVRLDFLGDRA